MNLPAEPETPYAFAVPTDVRVPATRLEAEIARTTGSVAVSSTALHTPGAEASGRRFVTLAPGQSLSWPTPVAADGVVVRYSYPDSADGSGVDGLLELEVDGRAVANLPVSSRYSWAYGTPAWGSTDVWSAGPSAGSPRHFWDEVSLRLASPITPGTMLAILNPATSVHPVLIDFVELEPVPAPLVAPPGSLSFADFSPAADGATDDTQKLAQALGEAVKQKRVLFVPPGRYFIGSVEMREGTLQGAGMWHTHFTGPRAQIRFTGGRVTVADFALFGETTKRNDQSDEGNAFAGRPADESRVERIWVEHVKCAFWVANAGEPRGPNRLRITGCRFRNLMADAVNFCNGTTDSMVDNTEVRNSGDDSLAAWSPAKGGPAGARNTFAHNSIQSPWVASGIALYGGGPFRVIGNRVTDTVTTGSGIYVSANFGAHPFRGLVDIADNVLVRCGAHESDWGGPTGAFRLLAADQDMTNAEFLFRHNTVSAPLESAVSIQGPHRIGGVRFDDLRIDDALVGIDVRPGAHGAASFIHSNADQCAAPFRNSEPHLFRLSSTR